jgi:Holliday junction resolvase-like predicted endonuclease
MIRRYLGAHKYSVRGKMKNLMKTIEPAMSLHEVMNRIQLRFMAEQTTQIKQYLPSLIENTSKVAPVRRNPYKLKRPDKRRELNRLSNAHGIWDEKHWEEACYHKWSKRAHGLAPSMPFRRTVSYQVMLRNTNADKGWGEIDLLAGSADKLPVVIELKSKTSEYLLRAVVEGVAYAVAIRKAWSQGNLRLQWQNRLAVSNLSQKLNTIAVVVAAPTSCWARWKGKTGQEKAFQVKKEALRVIESLRISFKECGYPITFVEIFGGEPSDVYGLPTIKKAKNLAII